MENTIQDNGKRKKKEGRPLSLFMIGSSPSLDPTNESRGLRGAEPPNAYRDYTQTTLSEILDLDLRCARLIIDPAYLCNFDCRFCSLPKKSDERIDWDRIAVILKALALSGLRRAVVSGGEPGIIAETPKILSGLRDMKISATVLTNGIWAQDKRRLERIVDAGAAGFLVSIKAFDEAGYKKTTGRRVKDEAWKTALSNFSALKANGKIGCFGVNVVITAINLESLQDTGWIEELPVRPQITLSLIEPYNDGMTALVPPPRQLRDSLHSLLDRLEKLGVEFAVEGMPLCLLGGRRHASIDVERLRDRNPRIFISPSNGSDHVLVHTGYQRLLQFSHLPPCDSCAVKPECPGPHKRTHRLYDEAGLAPFGS